MLRFTLDDRPIAVPDDVPGTTTLLRFLRDHLHETGTKEGCAEGDCGACTVAVEEMRDDGTPTWRAVNSCLLFLPMLQGKRVYTCRGIAADGPHPVQRAMCEHRASQCGYCTPGIVMALFEAAYRDDVVGVAEIDEQLSGNLCRCTGYRPIRDACRAVAGGSASNQRSAISGPPSVADPFAPARAHGERHLDRPHASRDQQYFQPRDLPELLELKARFPDGVLVAGGTDLGLEVAKKRACWPVVVGLEGVAELSVLSRTPTHWEIGAGVDLTRLMEVVAAEIPALHKHLAVFGSRQIRSRATVGGNLCNASPIGDLPPFFLALDATVVAVGSAGERRIPIDEFFVGYRKTALGPDEVLLRVELPHPHGQLLGAYKVSKRRQLDISIVAAAMAVAVEDGRIAGARLAYGGMAATPKRALHAEEMLVGRAFAEGTFRAASERLGDDFRPIDDHRGSARYRALLARNLLTGFFWENAARDPSGVGTLEVA